jgi:hypothetical protein
MQSQEVAYIARASRSMLRRPVEGLGRMRGRVDRRRDREAWRELGHTPHDVYRPDPDWERHLHELVGVSWPCETQERFRGAWSDLVARLSERGLRVGRATYAGWNDGDRAFAQAAWCLVQHLRPRTVVETGVAHGITSRIILEGLEHTGEGHLWSIDLKHLDQRLHENVGAAVPETLRHRWMYVEGSSRRRLPPLLEELGGLDLFVHDSLHTGRNVRFELDCAWRALRPGGALLVDDANHSLGFHSFTEAVGCSWLGAQHGDGGGIWAIAVKQGSRARRIPASAAR